MIILIELGWNFGCGVGMIPGEELSRAWRGVWVYWCIFYEDEYLCRCSQRHFSENSTCNITTSSGLDTLVVQLDNPKNPL
jgi:hypothetical protein